jgi:hypothetical protein
MHHVMGRGIERRKIFLDEQDRADFISRLSDLAELYPGSRRHEVVEAQGELSQVAVHLFGYSGAEAPRYLGVLNSSIPVSSKKMTEDLRIRYGE